MRLSERIARWRFSQQMTKEIFLFRMDMFMVDWLRIKRKYRVLYILPFLRDSWDIFAGEQMQVKRIEGRE